jgi:DNA-directed RNA polymerase specialized sigma24 family protein
MDQGNLNQRLSRIATRWSLVCKARSGSSEAARRAQLELLKNYSDAIHRYLLGALRDAHAAEELSQDFALRFIRGDFQGVDPRKGRFRDYVKTVLFHMVANYHKKRHSQPWLLAPDAPEPAAPPTGPPDEEEEFLAVWRGQVLERAWEQLAAIEKKSGKPYHTLLSSRREDPDHEVSSAQLAAQLSTQLRRKFTADGVRKTLQRARAKFAQLLMEEVAHSLQDPTEQQLEQELRDLGLLAYCRPALAKRSGKV